MEDGKIIDLFFQRSESALGALEEKYGQLCRSVIGRILPDPRDVEECASDALLRIWNSIPPERPQRLGGYLARVARNTALDRYDYNSAQIRSSALTVAYEELEACLPSQDTWLESHVFSVFINDFLRAQPKEARIFFVRRFWYGESVREIAHSCHCGEEKVKTSLFRTRNKLRTAMVEEGLSL